MCTKLSLSIAAIDVGCKGALYASDEVNYFWTGDTADSMKRTYNIYGTVFLGEKLQYGYGKTEFVWAIAIFVNNNDTEYDCISSTKTIDFHKMK